jgi:uncharacterized protein DUF6624
MKGVPSFRAVLFALVSLVTPRLAWAQVASCPALDTTAAWYRKQGAWADESRGGWSNDSLRTALLRAAHIDPRADAIPLAGFEIVDADTKSASGDSAALGLLRGLARTRGATWPTRSVVGPAGVRAVWLLVSTDSALARTALHRMMEAGPDESPPAAVATLEDRLRILNGRKQLYGTQLRRGADGALELLPIEDPGHVDLRRDAAGLPPVAQALCSARTKK